MLEKKEELMIHQWNYHNAQWSCKLQLELKQLCTVIAFTSVRSPMNVEGSCLLNTLLTCSSLVQTSPALAINYQFWQCHSWWNKDCSLFSHREHSLFICTAIASRTSSHGVRPFWVGAIESQNEKTDLNTAHKKTTLLEFTSYTLHLWLLQNTGEGAELVK